MTRKLFNFVMLTGLVAVLALAGFAQGAGVEGSYKVTATSSELGTVNFVLVLTKAADKWKGEIKDSPMPFTVNNVAVTGDDIVITADAGGTTVELKCKHAAGKLDGNWSAGDMKGTMTAMKEGAAAPAAAPAAAAPAAGGAAASYEGTYDAKVIADGAGELPFVVQVKKEGDKYTTTMVGSSDITISEVKIDGDNVTFIAAYQGQGPIMLGGKRTGNEMGGKWEAGGFSGTWKATKK